MTQAVEIPYQAEDGSYVVTVTAKDIDFFAKAAANPRIAEKTGERLVDALMLESKQDILRIERRKEGRLNDSPEGMPAISVFKDGDRKYVSHYHYRDDRLDDGLNGAPAIVEYRAEGLRVKRYNNGLLNDYSRDKPAISVFDANNVLQYVAHFKDGTLLSQKFADDLAAEREQARVARQAVRVKTGFGSRLKLVP